MAWWDELMNRDMGSLGNLIMGSDSSPAFDLASLAADNSDPGVGIGGFRQELDPLTRLFLGSQEDSPRNFNANLPDLGVGASTDEGGAYVPTESPHQSIWDTIQSGAKGIYDFAGTPLGKLGIGGLGALVGMYGANRQNQMYAKAAQDALAAKAAQRAQFSADTAPMRFANAKAATPWSGAGNRAAFSGNSLAAMAPRSTGTMYAATGGLASLARMRPHAPGRPIPGSAGGQDDVVDAKLAPGEYVWDADTVSALGDGNNEAGAQKLDQMRQHVRAHKRSAPVDQIPPKAKSPLAYLKGAK